MLESIKNCFHAQDLPGEGLLTPLKIYHRFFAEKIRKNSGLYKVAWTIANAVTGIFAYPIFGVVALFGMLIKSTRMSSLQKRSEKLRKPSSIAANARSKEQAAPVDKPVSTDLVLIGPNKWQHRRSSLVIEVVD